MKSFYGLFLLLPAVLGAPKIPTVLNAARDDPTSTTEVQDGQTGTLIVFPPQATETGLKKIPGLYLLFNICAQDLILSRRCRSSFHGARAQRSTWT